METKPPNDFATNRALMKALRKGDINNVMLPGSDSVTAPDEATMGQQNLELPKPVEQKSETPDKVVDLRRRILVRTLANHGVAETVEVNRVPSEDETAPTGRPNLTIVRDVPESSGAMPAPVEDEFSWSNVRPEKQGKLNEAAENPAPVNERGNTLDQLIDQQVDGIQRPTA